MDHKFEECPALNVSRRAPGGLGDALKRTVPRLSTYGIDDYVYCAPRCLRSGLGDNRSLWPRPNFRTPFEEAVANTPYSKTSTAFIRVLRRGERLWYEPSAVVYHAVPPNRLREPYSLTWWFDRSCAELLEFEVPETQSGSSRGFLCT